MKPKFGVVVFPGSNCDHDAYYAVKKVLGFEAEFIWHKEKDLKKCDVIILPGGFSYGDYLRTGAIAKFSPIVDAVVTFAEKGGIVFGICNGFQILLETGLLPGVMLQNKSLKFICKDICLKIESKNTPFTKGIKKDVIKIPIKHGEGNYYTDEKTLKDLITNQQILFRYSSPKGKIEPRFNPNGSLDSIAGISNKRRNVMGMMPHPENACDPILKKTDGALIFNAIASNL
jgi:phosphoribosylformylglycinamidine synthase